MNETTFSDVLEGLVDASDSELHERLGEIEMLRRRLDAETAAIVAVTEQRKSYAADGHRSVHGYLRAALNWSTADAARFKALGRLVDEVDGVGEAWCAGRFGLPQAALLAKTYANQRVAELLPAFAPVLLESAEQLSFSDFSVAVANFVQLADEDGAHLDRDLAIRHRDAHVSDVGGTLAVNVNGGDGLTAAEMIAVFDAFVEAEFRIDCEQRRAEHGAAADQHELPRTPGQRRFDAFCKIVRLAAQAGTGGFAADGFAADGSVPAVPVVVNVVVDESSWAAMQHKAGLTVDAALDGSAVDPFTGLADPKSLLDELMADPSHLLDRRCETSTGQVLHPHDVLRAALAGHTRRVVVNSAKVVIDLGRSQRLFVGSARQAAKLLIRTCEHPGCEVPATFSDVDHSVEWHNGGATDQSNSGIRCSSHNRDKTRRRLRTKRATNGFTYTIDEHGTVLLPVGARPPKFDEAA